MAEDIDGRVRGEDWWATSIIEMHPGLIRLRGYPIEDLIGRVSFPAMIWLMLRGDLPSEVQANLLGAALAAAVDHGPQAPSIAIARMAATCGIGINSAMASAINVLGDVHGGAGEGAVAFYGEIAAAMDGGAGLEEAVAARLDRFFAEGGRYVPGFGHRFHPVDPRAPRLLALVREAAEAGAVSGRFADIAEALEKAIAAGKNKRVPLNIDGATAVVYGALGFPPPLTRGLFVLSRSVGILAHAWEQGQRTERNKGPLPREWLWPTRGRRSGGWARGGEEPHPGPRHLVIPAEAKRRAGIARALAPFRSPCFSGQRSRLSAFGSGRDDEEEVAASRPACHGPRPMPREPAMAPPLLHLQGTALTFGGTPLLTDAELAVGPGERACLVGRNGSGKSTLLRIAAGLVEPDRGTRFVQPGATVRYLSQEPDLSAHPTTLAVVEAGLGPGDDPHRALMLLHELGLSGDEPTDRLSGGEARRTALAQALAPRPDILLLDEPTNHSTCRRSSGWKPS
jgi:citrate synthase